MKNDLYKRPNAWEPDMRKTPLTRRHESGGIGPT